MSSINSKTVVLIHGAFVHYSGWDNWKTYLENKGYTVIAKPWPAKEAAPEVLRGQHPNSPIANLRLMQVINHYDAIVRALPEKPIIIGHSLGGLITQILVNRGLSAAGICIHPVLPQNSEFVHMGGTWGKEQEINIIQSGNIWYKKADIHEVSVKILGNTAIVYNRITLIAVVGGNEVTNNFMVTEVYVKEGDNWKMGSMSFTKLIN